MSDRNQFSSLNKRLFKEVSEIQSETHITELLERFNDCFIAELTDNYL